MIPFGRLTLITVAALTVGCGQKGPPLAPLHLVPAAPPNVSVSRVSGDARVRFDVPSTNQNGPGAVVIDRVEVYAATVAAGALRPSNRELLTAKYRVGTIPIKPPPVEGETPAANAPPDNRPAAGERAAFVETLTPEKLKPVFTTPAPKVPPPPLPGTPTPLPIAPGEAAAPAVPAVPAAAAAAPGGAPVSRRGARTPAVAPPTLPGVPTPRPVAPPVPGAEPTTPAAAPPVLPPPPAVTTETTPYAARIYTIRGVTKGGRPGTPSTRLELPLVSPPATPPPVAATASETAIVLTWTPPAAGGAVTYNIYKAGGSDPLSSGPAGEGKYERAGVQFGTEECFVLRAVQKIGRVDFESEPSPQVCITPRDTFPPAAPKGLSVVAGTGTINLGWDANAEADLAGYLVLRGEAPGDTLQPLMPAPIAGTSYEDKTARPGVRYVYAIVAVDKASPPNRSAPSARVEETAR